MRAWAAIAVSALSLWTLMLAPVHADSVDEQQLAILTSMCGTLSDMAHTMAKMRDEGESYAAMKFSLDETGAPNMAYAVLDAVYGSRNLTPDQEARTVREGCLAGIGTE